MIKCQSSFINTLSSGFSSMLTILLKNFNPNPENVVSCADCSEGYESEIVAEKFSESSFIKTSKGFRTNHNHNSYCVTTAAPLQTTLPTACPNGMIQNFNDVASNDYTMQSIHKADPSLQKLKYDIHTKLPLESYQIQMKYDSSGNLV